MIREQAKHELPYWGLAAFCLVSPLSIAAANAAWVVALLLWLYQSWVGRRPGAPVFRRTPLDQGFGLLLVASLLSLVTSLAPRASLVEMRSLGLIVVYYLFAGNVRTDRERRFLVLCLLGSTSLAALYGIGEYLTGRDLFGHYDPRVTMIGGFFSMHLTFGEYLVLVICLAAGILLHGKPGKPLRAVAALALVFMLPALYMSWAKGAFLGLLAGGAVLFGLQGRKRLLAALVVVLVFFLLVASWKSGALFQEFVSLYAVDATQETGTANSNTQRLYMWWSGLRISPGYFLNGVGLHAVEAVYPSFRHPLARDPNQWHLHNNFVQLGVETGMFGLAAFLFLFLLAGQKAYRRFQDSRDSWEKGVAAGLLGALPAFLVCGLTEYNWADSEVLMALYMLLGLALPAGRAVSEALPGHPIADLGDPVPSSLSCGSLPCPGLETSIPSGRASAAGDSTAEAAALPQALLAVLLLALGCTSFLAAGPNDPTPVRILEIGAGLAVLGFLFFRPSASFLAGPRRAQAAACLVVFAGYRFTQPWWAAAAAVACDPTPACLTAVCLLLTVPLLLPAQFLRRRGSSAAWTLFDLAVCGAAWVWLAAALGTNLLLRLAGGGGSVLDPPFPVLLLLCTLFVLLYGTVRVLYRGARVQDYALAGLALFLLLHALR